MGDVALGARAPASIYLDGIRFDPDNYAGERAFLETPMADAFVGEIEWDSDYLFHKARRDSGDWRPVRSPAEGRAFIVGTRSDLYPGIPTDQRPKVEARA